MALRFRIGRRAAGRVSSVCVVAALMWAGCNDTGTQPESQNPQPILQTIDPASAEVGTPLTLTAIGSSFVAESEVRWNGAPLNTGYVSTTALVAEVPESLLGTGGSVAVTVHTPPPAGGTSAERILELRYALPTITALSQDTVIAGASDLTIGVQGTGFSAASTVLLDGLARATTVTGPGELTFVLTAADRTAGSVAQIAVHNPLPGGGTSDVHLVHVINPQPVITVLPSQGATAGGGGFLFTLHGTHFVEGAEVLWNGVQRAATRTGATRLAVVVSAADVATPGEVELRVVNPGTPPRVSEPAVFTVWSFDAPASSVSRVALRARHLRADPVRSLLYASVGSASPTHPNSVVLIDPQEGEIVGSLFVGSEPNRLAVAHDGSFLYVALDGASAVAQVVLSAMTPGVQWSLPAGQVATAMEVAPGHPGTVALSRHRLGFSPSLAGTTVYDNGVQRPSEGPGHTGASRIAFADSPHVLYGYNDLHTGFGFYTLHLNESGIYQVEGTGGLISGFSMEIAGSAGRIYASGGQIVDPELLTRVATLPTGGGFAVDAARGRIHFMRPGYVEVWDLNTLSKRGEIPVPGFAPGTQVNHSLLRWGSDGLAVLEQDNVILIRSSLVGSP